MEVTKHNFKEALEKITSLVKDADFISFDLELTGLGRSLGERDHELDTPEERYQKAVRRVKEYGITQIGISIFRYCKSSNKYLNATFTFFLSGKMEGSYRFDTSSMIFLAENGFDFNKLFLEGLTFISLTDEFEIRKKRKVQLEQEQESSIPSPVKFKDPKVKSFASEAVKQVKKSLPNKESVVFEGKTMNGFLRKVLFNNVAPMFPTSHFQTVSGLERNVTVTHFDSKEDKRTYLDSTWEDELREQLGFVHVVKAVLESNKPLIGHNMILDILHFVDKFVVPLPPTLGEFKSVVKANLPTIYDTKILAKDPPFSANIIHTGLQNLYEELTTHFSPPKFGAEKGHLSYDAVGEGGQAHDGGYDAFMTGVAFIAMVKTLEGKQFGKTALMKSRELEAYANKINFMRSYDMPYINLDKSDVIPDRSHMYNVSCPTTWTGLNVRNAFACLKGYKTIWVNETRLFVIPQDEGDISRAKLLLQEIQTACPPTVKVNLFELKKNGKLNSGGLKTRSAEVPRPSSINLKRSSDTKDAPSAVSSEDGLAGAEEGIEAGRNLKRLKSVGSELLSNMTLESPMNVDPEHPIQAGQKEKDAKSDVFSVPEEW